MPTITCLQYADHQSSCNSSNCPMQHVVIVEKVNPPSVLTEAKLAEHQLKLQSLLLPLLCFSFLGDLAEEIEKNAYWRQPLTPRYSPNKKTCPLLP